jgi:hypothetical protein
MRHVRGAGYSRHVTLGFRITDRMQPLWVDFQPPLEGGFLFR